MNDRDLITNEPAPLESLGLFIREVRKSRNLTQDQLADQADVSRKQVALLEKGQNVSVVFLLKILKVLDFEITLPFHGSGASPRADFNVGEMMRAADLLAGLVAFLRSFAVNAVLPPSERGALQHAPAVQAWVERHLSGAALHEEASLHALEDAMQRLASSGASATPPRATALPARGARPARKARK